jgi:peroxiredoxin family protein
MERKLRIVFASGATNKICCVVVYSAAALASRYRFYVHLVNEGLVAFRKDVLPRLNDTGIAAAPVSALR